MNTYTDAIKPLSQLPGELNVLGSKIKIEYKEGLISPDGDSVLGLAIFGSNLIQLELSKDIPGDSLVSTLLHEVLEHINYKLELNLKHTQLSSLETSLFQVLVSNKELITLFFAGYLHNTCTYNIGVNNET